MELFPEKLRNSEANPRLKIQTTVLNNTSLRYKIVCVVTFKSSQEGYGSFCIKIQTIEFQLLGFSLILSVELKLVSDTPEDSRKD